MRRVISILITTMMVLAAAPAVASPEEQVRPGSRIAGSRGRCTINFVFSDRSSLYAGTAGHCVRQGESIYSYALGRALGRVVFKIHEGYYRDFALIEIYPELRSRVDPAAGAVPGPTRIAAKNIQEPTEVQHLGYGYGLGYIPWTDERQPVTYVRRGLALSLDDPRELHFLGAVAPGDSGSGAYLPDGAALGVITVAEVEISTDEGAKGTVGGGRLRPLLRAAASDLGVPIYLVTTDGSLVR